MAVELHAWPAEQRPSMGVRRVAGIQHVRPIQQVGRLFFRQLALRGDTVITNGVNKPRVLALGGALTTTTVMAGFSSTTCRRICFLGPGHLPHQHHQQKLSRPQQDQLTAFLHLPQ